ncbi:Bro-N domain-containing protein [Macrococcus sp. EM39E]|uniref:BRO-N domain-containing protein n=1 Tax=Macrococcus animalis TaxID=3395467 RepID=UPI0039BEB68D
MEIDNEPYFVGNDVAQILGYEDYRGAISKKVDNEDKLRSQINHAGQNRHVTLINESGLYALIFSSKLDSAKRFKRWVTSEVLPQIRKTGSYNVDTNNNFNTQELLQDPNKLVELLEMVTQEIKNGQVLQLESQEMKKELKVKEEELNIFV